MRHALAPLLVVLLLGGCTLTQEEPSARPQAEPESRVARGKHLVEISGCHDCHSPKVFGPEGPVPDEARLLSGHPQDEVLPDAPAQGGPWAVHANVSITAWGGPWGVAYASNLTPDAETGIGNYTEEAFLQAMRSGKRFGTGRPLLPPMPWPAIAQNTDEDLKAIFAYLQSLPTIKNRVPEPVIAPPPAP